MSKYTTEVRFICETAIGYDESKGYSNVNDIVTKACPLVFDFDFPIFDENYRSVLEKKILKHFYTREICEETVGLWKLRMDTKLNEIMPYYNQLYKSELLEFNPLYTTNLKRQSTTGLESKRNENENISDTSSSNRTTSNTENTSNNSSSTGKVTDSGTVNSNGSADGTTSGTSQNNHLDLYSDTPQGALTGVENETYLTNARKVTDNGSTSGTSHDTNSNTTTSSDETNTTGSASATGSKTDNGTDNSTGTYGRTRGNTDNLNSTEDYLANVTGYIGTSASELIEKYRKTFLNIDMMVIKDLEVCFFQLW